MMVPHKGMVTPQARAVSVNTKPWKLSKDLLTEAHAYVYVALNYLLLVAALI